MLPRYCTVVLSVIIISACGGGGSESTTVSDNNSGNTDTNTDSESNSPFITPSDTSQPNFLFIISDDQGLDASAQYSISQDLPTTPVIDSLAARGIVFDNAWATPSCTTTRGCIISGQHGVNNGVTTTPALLDTSTLTLQRHLANNQATQSYQSAVIGKWHLAGGNTNNQQTHPNEVGVDYYAGNLTGALDSYNDWPLNINGVTSNETTYHTTKVTDLAIDWIEEQNNPWFMWLAYVSPHSPFHLPPEDLHTQTLSGNAADIQNNPRPYYLAAIEAMDTEIGRLLDSLPAATLDNTMIIFMGDNGTPRAVIDTAAYNNTHGKSSLYEGGVRVPMVVAGFGVNRQNERDDALINTADLFPTVSEAAGIPIPDSVDGRSFMQRLSNATASSREFNYSEFVGDIANGWTVRNDEMKLIVFADGSRELYNLIEDPREDINLINQSQFQSDIDALAAFGNQVRNGDSPDTSGSVDITNAILVNRNPDCSVYANQYSSQATDINQSTTFTGDLTVTVEGNTCVFTTNAIPNHDFNDAARDFPNAVSEQEDRYSIPINPQLAASTTPLSLTVNNAILLNGVVVDILAAGCFGVGDGRIGCNDPEQPWRFDPLSPLSGFSVDSHNAHSQPDGTYHYHGEPNALYASNEAIVSPVAGFAADGFPIFGSYINDNGSVRTVQSSYRLRSGNRPSGNGQPGGTFDGTYRDDYEYVEGLGDLDECNGRMVNGQYRYHITSTFPYVLGCFRGVPDDSFTK